jgi:hypothetical protein
VTVPPPAPVPVPQRQSGSIFGTGELTEMLGGIKPAIARASDASRIEITGEMAGLLADVRDGTRQVVRAFRIEAMKLRAELGQIVGNGPPADDQAD